MKRRMILFALTPAVWTLAFAAVSGAEDRTPAPPIQNGWRHFGDTPQTPVKPDTTSKQRAKGRQPSPVAASNPSRSSRAVVTRINTVEDGPPQAKMLYYEPAEQKARSIFAIKPSAGDHKSVISGVETPGTARVVEYTERDIISVRTRLRYTTIIALPPGEQIMDFVIGDKDNWVVNGAANLAYVKPAKADAATNLNLISSRNVIYSFVLAELGDGTPDLKIFVQPHGEAIQLALNGPVKYIPVERIDEYRLQAEAARGQAKDAQLAVQKTIESKMSSFTNSYTASVNFGYRFQRNKKPFEVSAIFDDGRFTYIKARPMETPTLYEVKDGTPSIVNFEYRDGTYIVGKVLESGYLAIGKKRFVFTRER